MISDIIEILAPAGSFESLQAAINAGADAVYFGVGDINMRASAAINFTIDDLDEIVKRCHTKNVKAYLTLNVLLFDHNIREMQDIMDASKKAGIDAVIAADISAIQYANEINLEVHVSTQLSISNIDAVKFYSKFSDRLVLARELTLHEVKYICNEIKKQNITGPKGNLVEIEVFAHGALCVAVSGRCGMSLHCSNSSANLGKCSQVCRKPYKVTDIQTGQELVVDNNYIMSSADLCTVGMLDLLLDTGVSVLKFEGRGKSPDYVDTVIRTYREAVDSVRDGSYSTEKVEKWNKELGTVFNRGMSKGFYMGRSYAEWSGVHGSKSKLEKTHIGEIQRYYPKIKVAEALISAKETLGKGEQILIIGQNTGVVKLTIDKFRVEEEELEVVKQNDIFTFEVPSRVRNGDKIYVLRERESLTPRGRKV